MPSKRWDPLQDLIGLHQEMFGNGSGLGMAESSGAAWSPDIDVYETDQAFVLKAELPGLDPDQIKVEYRNHRLILSGERPAVKPDQMRRYHHVERAYGPFERIFALPYNVQGEAIEAHYQDGVIEVIVPKKPEPGTRNIDIKG